MSRTIYISANPNKYNVISAFSDLKEIYWYNANNFKFQNGDTVYIYVTSLSKIAIKAIVTEQDVSYQDTLKIDDSKYWIKSKTQEELSSFTYGKLSLDNFVDCNFDMNQWPWKKHWRRIIDEQKILDQIENNIVKKSKNANEIFGNLEKNILNDKEIDKGAKFVLNNFIKAHEVASKIFNGRERVKICAKINNTYLKLSNFSKTGNMYLYFLKFQSGQHPDAELFKWMSDYKIIRNEDMAAYLFHNYRNEIANIEYWWDWEPGIQVKMSKICAFFGGSAVAGGIRYNKETNTVVIITSQHTQGKYIDNWIDGVLHYTWFNAESDKTWKTKVVGIYKNRVLDGSKIVLFEQLSNSLYKYHGRVVLDGPAEFEENGMTMKILLRPTKTIINYDDLKTVVDNAEKQLLIYNEDDLMDIAIESSKKSKTPKLREAMVYDRNPQVSLATKTRAHGVCDLCGKPAPFLTLTNIPYLETHHVKPLCDNGPDTIYNTVALCPNCHREIHIRKDPKKIKILINKINKYLNENIKTKQYLTDFEKLFNNK